MQEFIRRNYYVVFGVLLTASLGCAFQLGVIHAGATTGSTVALNCNDDVLRELAIPLTTAQSAPAALPDLQAQNSPVVSTPQGQFLGSKNGTKYYTPQCSGAERIKVENIVWFADAQDAALQGYTPANCP